MDLISDFNFFDLDYTIDRVSTPNERKLFAALCTE